MKKYLILVFILLSSFSYSQSVAESNSEYYKISSKSKVGESKGRYFRIIGNSTFTAESTPVYYKIFSENLNADKSSTNYSEINKEVTNPQKNVIASNLEIPATKIKSENTYALVVGNEDYNSYQTGLEKEQNVDYATNDSRLFKELLIKTLGIPNENIVYLENAGYIKMKQAISQLESISKHAGKDATIIFYYAGHGLPDEKTKGPYLIPVDVTGSTLQYGISLSELYQSLSKYEVKKTIVLLDACFTGGARNAGLIASRGAKIVPKQSTLSGDLIVFSASSADQSAKPYKEKEHGLFTYFLMKKIVEKSGDITLGELGDYLIKTIPIKSILINKTEQIPQINTSKDINEKWRNWKLVN